MQQRRIREVCVLEKWQGRLMFDFHQFVEHTHTSTQLKHRKYAVINMQRGYWRGATPA